VLERVARGEVGFASPEHARGDYEPNARALLAEIESLLAR
jgi:hypothetical protein